MPRYGAGTVHSVIGRIVIEAVRPRVDCGQWPARAVAGETVPVSATIFRDGHNVVVAAAIRVLGPDDPSGRKARLVPLVETNPGLHHWEGQITIPPGETGLWRFSIVAWTDELATWERATRKKLAAGQGVALDLEEGARLLEGLAGELPAQVAEIGRAHV